MDELSSIKSSQSYKRVIFQDYIILNIVFSTNLCKRISKIKVTNVATNQHLYFTEQFKPDNPYMFQLWTIRPKSFVTIILMLANHEGQILCEGTFSTRLQADEKFVNLSNKNGNLMKNIKATLKYKKCIQKMINQKIKLKQKVQKLKTEDQKNDIMESRLKILNNQIDGYLQCQKNQTKSYERYLTQSNLFLQNLQKNSQHTVGRIIKQKISSITNNYRRIGTIKTNPSSSAHTNKSSDPSLDSLPSRNSLKLQKINIKKYSNSSLDQASLTPIVNTKLRSIYPTKNAFNHLIDKKDKKLSEHQGKKRNFSLYENILDQKTRKLSCVKQQTFQSQNKKKKKLKKLQIKKNKQIQIEEDSHQQILPKSLKNLDKNSITLKKSVPKIKLLTQKNEQSIKLFKKQSKIQKNQHHQLQKEQFQFQISSLKFHIYQQIPNDDELSVQIFNSSKQQNFAYDLYQLSSDQYTCKEINCYLPQIKKNNALNIKIINSSNENQIGKMSIILNQLLEKNIYHQKYKHFIMKQNEIIGHIIISYEIKSSKQLKKSFQKSGISKKNEQKLQSNHLQRGRLQVNEGNLNIQRRKLLEENNKKIYINQKN